MKSKEEWLRELDLPDVLLSDGTLSIDSIEQPVATPEENGVATLLINSISDTWNKINDYNSILTTISDTDLENAEEVSSIVKDVVDEENKNVGRLVSALKKVSPNTNNIDLGQEEAEMKLTEESEDNGLENEEQVVVDDNFIEEEVQKPMEKKPNQIGTIRYNANEGRKNRISLYRKLTCLDEDVQLTEDGLKKWAVDRVACFTNTTPERVRSELLGNKWSEFEED